MKCNKLVNTVNFLERRLTYIVILRDFELTSVEVNSSGTVKCNELNHNYNILKKSEIPKPCQSRYFCNL